MQQKVKMIANKHLDPLKSVSKQLKLKVASVIRLVSSINAMPTYNRFVLPVYAGTPIFETI